MEKLRDMLRCCNLTYSSGGGSHPVVNMGFCCESRVCCCSDCLVLMCCADVLSGAVAFGCCCR
jgi:hypothetical protein